MLKPQKYDAQTQQKFYTWCEINKLDEYIDYTESQYRPGRLRLGEINKTYKIQDIQELVIEFPSIKEIMLINDK
jgi:hypothetical protein